MAAVCFGALTTAAGGGDGGAIGAGAVLRTGSGCGLDVIGSSLRLFHTLRIPSLITMPNREAQHLEGQLLYLWRTHVRGSIQRNFYVRLFAHHALPWNEPHAAATQFLSY
jgi:hypothetical protein